MGEFHVIWWNPKDPHLDESYSTLGRKNQTGEPSSLKEMMLIKDGNPERKKQKNKNLIGLRISAIARARKTFLNLPPNTALFLH